MSFEVILSDLASKDVESAYTWWANHRSKEQAYRWYAEFFRRLLDLEKNPSRFSKAQESRRFKCEIHQMNFGIGRNATHRALFIIRQHEVYVLRVRHLAQRELTERELRE